MEKKRRRIQFRRQLDSPWSWVVCFSSFTVQFLILGTHNSFGSFFVALLDKFQRSEAETGKNLSLFSANTVDWLWIIYCNNRLRRKTLSLLHIFYPPYRQKKLFSDRFSWNSWNKDSYFLLLYLAARSNEWQVMQTNLQNAKQADSTDNVKIYKNDFKRFSARVVLGSQSISDRQHIPTLAHVCYRPWKSCDPTQANTSFFIYIKISARRKLSFVNSVRIKSYRSLDSHSQGSRIHPQIGVRVAFS